MDETQIGEFQIVALSFCLPHLCFICVHLWLKRLDQFGGSTFRLSTETE